MYVETHIVTDSVLIRKELNIVRKSANLINIVVLPLNFFKLLIFLSFLNNRPHLNFFQKHSPIYHQPTQAVGRRCSMKKVFLKSLQISQENSCARVSYLIKLQAKATYRTLTEHLQTTASAVILCAWVFSIEKQSSQVFYEQAVLRLLQNSQENNCTGVSF